MKLYIVIVAAVEIGVIAGSYAAVLAQCLYAAIGSSKSLYW